MKHPSLSVLLALVLILWLAASAPHARTLAATHATPPARYGHTLTNVNGVPYLFGGANTAAFANFPARPTPIELDDLYRFHEQEQEFVQLAPPQSPPARRYHAAAAWNGHLFIFGGLSGVNLRNDVWEYDPAANTWTEKTSTGFPPYGLWGSSAVTFDDYIYLFGGWTPSGLTRLIYKYNPATGDWSFSGSLPNNEPRYAVSTAVVGTHILVYGGANETKTYDDMQLYDPSIDFWYGLALNNAPLAASAASFAYDWEGLMFKIAVLVFGGADADGTPLSYAARIDHITESSSPFNSSRELDVLDTKSYSGTLTALTPLPVARTEHAAAMLAPQGGQVRVLIFGGLENGQAVADQLIYTTPCPDAPEKPVLAAPANNKTITLTRPKLKWNAIGCAATYSVIVKEGSRSGVKKFSASNLQVPYVKTTALTRGKTYYWQVTAVNAAGKTKSAWFHFTVQ